MRGMINIALLLAALALSLGGGDQALADAGWMVGLFGGRATFDSLHSIFTDRDYADSYMTGLTVGKGLTGYKHYLSLEGEGQVAKHWGDQDHFEFTAALVLRWLPFPWDRYLDTSVAVGEGLSLCHRRSGNRSGKT
jgi:hypothetical protein